MIPTSIDGTDITGATIDGTDVQEITVDGDVVFSAAPDIVAKGNLVYWLPFDGNINDVTAGDSSYGDTTDYTGVANNVSFVSSPIISPLSGQTQQASSYDGSTSEIDLGDNALNVDTYCFWANPSSTFGNVYGDDSGSDRGHTYVVGTDTFGLVTGGANTLINETTSGWNHFALTDTNIFKNGVDRTTHTGAPLSSSNDYIGRRDFGQFSDYYTGEIADFRWYNRKLSNSEIQQIVQNTQDPSNPVFP